MTAVKHEDAVMKMGFDYFRDTIMKMLNIHYQFVDCRPTELIEIDIENLYMDYNFLTTENCIIHIEFQTTENGIKDLLRFRVYEALLARKEQKKVITYVIYSGGIDHAVTEMDCGINTYRVHPIYLTGLQADKILKNVKSKIESGFTLNEEDFANLTLTPLMASTMSRKDIIKEAIQIVRQEKQPTAEKTMAMLYTLADKFLNTDELEEIKEVLTVTRLGQMIYDDGIKKGIEQGIEKGIEQGIEQEEMRNSALIANLLKEKRVADLQRSAEDREYRKKLLKEFGLDR